MGGVVRTHQQPTHPTTNSHPATTHGFSAATHRLTLTAILGLMLERRNNGRTTNAVANRKMLLVGDVVVRTQQQPTRPRTHTLPATIQGFFADTHL